MYYLAPEKLYEININEVRMKTYQPTGVCAQNISFSVKDGKVHNVSFTGGCNGNLQGISRLIEGMHVDEVIQKLKGTRCGGKETSCPDQLANALAAYR